MRVNLSDFDVRTECPRCGAAMSGTIAPLCGDCLDAQAAKHHVRDEASGADRALCVKRYVGSVPGDDEGYRYWAKTPTRELPTAMVLKAPALSADDRKAVLDVGLDVRMLLVVGMAGAGKTTFAVARGRMLAEHGHDVMFCDALTVAGAARDTRLGHTCDALYTAKAAPVLVLDELGRDLSLGPIASAAIVSLIFHRDQHRLRTIVTSGMTSEALRAGYDDGMWRRIAQGAAKVVRVGPKRGER